MITGLVKGDSILFSAKAGEDITNWKIRAELWDSGTVDIKKATANSGGADSQIEITDATNGLFTIKILKTETTDINDEASLEIEIENTEGLIWTVYSSVVKFTSQKITWVTP